MGTSRITLRIDESLKKSAEKAATLQGMKNLTEYIVRLIQQDSERVIREYFTITLKSDVFECFVETCEAADAPNEKLRNASNFSNIKGIQ